MELERRIGLRRDAPRAPISVPERLRAAAYAVARNAAQRPHPTLAYSKRKMVLTKGSTLLTRMAEACHESSWRQLCWTADWHVREDCYAQALAVLTDAQVPLHPRTLSSFELAVVAKSEDW